MKWIKFLLSINLDDPRSTAYKTREGEAIQVDEAFKAWTCGDLAQMLDAVSTETHLIDRHFLLQRIVSETYKLRNDPHHRDLCLQHARLHIDEFDDIAPVLKKEMDGTLPRVTTFQHFATILAENKEYDRAILVCEKAMDYGLHDGTKSGFKGRVKRIEKQKEKG